MGRDVAIHVPSGAIRGFHGVPVYHLTQYGTFREMVIYHGEENFDDIGNFPTEALLTNVTEQSPNFSLKDVVLVFVHVMSNELLKVKLVGHQGKLGKAISF